MSQKKEELSTGYVFIYETQCGRRNRWSELHPVYRTLLLVLALALNVTIALRHTCPWLNSVFATSSHLATTYPDEQMILGTHSHKKLWPVQKYKTETFLAPDMTVTKTGSTASGYLFINPWGNGTAATGPVIITDANELVWHGPSTDTTNLRVQSLHGEPVISFWNGTSTATFGHGYGSISVLDTTYTKIAEVCMKHLNLKTPYNEQFPCYLDMHESYLTDRGSVIATAYNVTSHDLSSVGGPKKGWIFNSLFYEIDIATEEVLFRWSSLDHVATIPITDSQLPLKTDSQKFGSSENVPWDYFHINSVHPMIDGFLVNARHTFAMYKINFNGDIEWQLQGIHGGDFSLAPGIRFAWQHHPRVKVDMGSKLQITLYNNDNSQTQYGEHETTGLDLELDLNARTASLNRRLADPADTIFSASQGSHQVLDGGHSLVGYGQVAKVKEFDAVGDVVYTAQFGASTDKLRVASYRAYRYGWQATPKFAPRIAAEASHSRTDVYLSWNGATNVRSWMVYAGDSREDMKLVAAVPKSDFETAISLPYAFQYVQAEAVLEVASGEVAQASRRTAIQRASQI